MTIENVIFSNLVHNEEYARKVLPFLMPDYFSENKDKVVFGLITSFVDKYGAFPTPEALAIDLTKLKINDETFEEAKHTIATLSTEKKELKWLVDTTEEFCKEKAIYNALMKAINIVNDKKGKIGTGAIPQIMMDALSISFESNIGHDYIEDAESRYDYLHDKKNKIPFSLNMLNKITNGGMEPKSLIIVMAGTGIGKTIHLCCEAAYQLMQGKNVLYITLEMASEKIAQRIDENLMDITLDEYNEMTKDEFLRRLVKIKEKVVGKLKILEYPTSSASVNNFRHDMNELKIKEDFEPNIIIVDYLNICKSARMNNSEGTYLPVKAIAEELRAFACEKMVPLMTAAQLDKPGNVNSDPTLNNVAESFGIAKTTDLLYVIISDEEMDALGQCMFKQLKNRWGDMNKNRRFMVGIDRSKMQLYDLDESAQTNVAREAVDVPIMDTTTFGEADLDRKKPFDKSKFKNFF